MLEMIIYWHFINSLKTEREKSEAVNCEERSLMWEVFESNSSIMLLRCGQINNYEGFLFY